jgi:deoxyribonuclease V
LQDTLGRATPEPWHPPARELAIAGVIVCFQRKLTGMGTDSDPAWAAAAVICGGRCTGSSIVRGQGGAPYQAGLLAVREGPLVEAAVRALPSPSDVLLVNATGRDRPLNAGMALHLGWALSLPTVGVTHRPLFATGDEPGPVCGDRSPLSLNGHVVGARVRTREGARDVSVTPGWRTDVDTAVEVVLKSCMESRTPEPLRQARQLARTARSRT